MATTRKSTTTTKEKAETSTDVLALLEEINKLKAELKEMKENTTTSVIGTTELVEEPQEKMIRFISLAKGSVMLKGTASKPYEIEGQYNDRTFTETEAKAICTLMGAYMREGFVYIDDAQFVKSMGLSEAYRHMLSPDTLKDLFNKSPEIVISAYENASEGQKKIIMDMVIEKQSKGEVVDANILQRLGKLSGVDLMSISDEE